MTEPVAATPAPDVLRCPSCGAEVTEAERFCEACGAPLSPTVEVVDEAVQAAQGPLELSPPLAGGAAPPPGPPPPPTGPPRPQRGGAPGGGRQRPPRGAP